MARPKKWTERRRKEVRNRLFDYVRKHAKPSVADFCVREEIPRSKLYSWEEVKDALDLLRAKREKYWEEKLDDPNNKNTSGAIFALKQLGWSDRQEVNNTGEVTHKHVVEMPKQDTVEEWQQQRQLPENQSKLEEKMGEK